MTNRRDGEQWLRECPFGEWVPFDSIPDKLFDDVFDLINEGFLGWVYIFDDFDLEFKKNLPERNSTDKEPLRTQRAERFIETNRRFFNIEISHIKK